jgi:hypothetical protein
MELHWWVFFKAVGSGRGHLITESCTLQVRYFAWLEEKLQSGAKLTEYQAADQLEAFRKWVFIFCLRTVTASGH